MTGGIGLCGGHRTGKTTLANRIAEAVGVPFLKTDTSRVFADHGIHPSDPMDAATRLAIQWEVVKAAETIWQESSGPFITDRTPVDMMAYTLADIRGDTRMPYENLADYLAHCFEATNRFFNRLIIVQPGIPLIYEEGKAALNQAYIEHLNAVILGLCRDERLTVLSSVIPRDKTDLAGRIAAGVKSLN